MMYLYLLIERREVMKVLVIGAHGKIGQILTKKLHDSNDFEEVAGLRTAEQRHAYEEAGVQTVAIDLEKEQTDLEKAMQGVDAVVFTAGSGGKTGPEKTMMIDLDGAIKSIKAAENVGVKRFVIVSAINANKREFWSYGRHDLGPTGNFYYAAKHYADLYLENSELDYTILRPTLLLDDEGTGKVTVTDDLAKVASPKMKVPRADVAATILAVLNNQATVRHSFDLDGGDTPIKEAIDD